MTVWALNEDWNQNYFGSLEELYADKNEVICSGTQRVGGISFYPKNNRIAPRIWAVNPDGSSGQWLKMEDMNNEYFGSLEDFYADTNPVYVPSGKIIIGFRFWQKNNRIAPEITVSKPDGSEREPIRNEVMNENYFGDLEDIYVDSNDVVLCPGNQIFGISLYKKENRLAPKLWV